MFKYSLFICKCSERESHFDCDIDCHFDCNLQLIVNFLSDNMSELKGVRSGAERMKKYRAENKQKSGLVLDLVVKKKMLPNDPFYKAVLIKESRKKSTVTNVLDDDDYNSD